MEPGPHLTIELHIIRQAKKLLERYGWQKGHYGPVSKGRIAGLHCVTGAIVACINNTNMSDWEKILIGRAVQRRLKKETQSNDIVLWNDKASTTKEDVLNALSAIEREIVSFTAKGADVHT